MESSSICEPQYLQNLFFLIRYCSLCIEVVDVLTFFIFSTNMISKIIKLTNDNIIVNIKNTVAKLSDTISKNPIRNNCKQAQKWV